MKQDIRTSMLDRDVWRGLSNTDARVEDHQDYPRHYSNVSIYIYICKEIIELIIIALKYGS